MHGARGRWWRGAIMAISFVLLALFTLRLVDDFRAYRRAVDLKAERVASLERLVAERDEARSMLEKLRTDSLTREQLLRSNGYVRPGEQVYVIVPSAHATTEGAP